MGNPIGVYFPFGAEAREIIITPNLGGELAGDVIRAVERLIGKLLSCHHL